MSKSSDHHPTAEDLLTEDAVTQFINDIPSGQTQDLDDLKRALAPYVWWTQERVEILHEIVVAVASKASDKIKSGASERQVLPFWRLLSSKDKKLVRKIGLYPRWVDGQRQREEK